MRICFFHLKAHAIFDSKSEAPVGGTLVQLHVLAKRLASDPSNQVSFLVGDYGQDGEETYEHIRVFRSVKLQRTIWNMLKVPFCLWQDFQKINADIYITSSASPEVGLLVLFGWFKRKKIIYRVAHEWDCSGEYVTKHGIFGKIFEWGIIHAHSLVVQSKDQQSLLKRRYARDSVIIPNSYFIVEPQDTQKEGVLWVSRCERWKNPVAFLRLAETLPQYRFTMICPRQKYQEELYEQVFSQAKKLRNLNFIDFVPFESIQGYFDRAKVFVGTSDYEGFPNTYLQACMGHTPVLSLIVDPDHFILNYDIGYVAEGDEKRLRESLVFLLQDVEEWRKKSKNAFRYICETHDIERNIQKWKALFV